MKRALKLVARQGDMAVPKEVLGQYDPNTNVVRVKKYSAIDTFVHEAGHALDFNNTGILPIAEKFGSEVRALDYDPDREDRTDCFA